MTSNIEEFARKRNVADPEREIWEAEDCAVYWGIHPDTVRAQAKKGLIPAFKIGDKWRFKSAKMRAFEGSSK